MSPHIVKSKTEQLALLLEDLREIDFSELATALSKHMGLI